MPSPGTEVLLIEDCVAHHIEGIYREWTQCSGIPEWRDYEVPDDDGFRASAGIAVSGRGSGHHDPRLRPLSELVGVLGHRREPHH